MPDVEGSNPFARFSVTGMLGITEQSGSALVNLWCLVASNAPVVAVIARLYGPNKSTCILRWNWKKALLEEGAWTSMRIAAHRCCLSPDGEFLLYHATGSPNSPFPGSFGGAKSISRLPWLSALTDTNPGPVPEFRKSRDSLPEDQQQRLWQLFAKTRHDAVDWPGLLGHRWRNATVDDMQSVTMWDKSHSVAAANIPDCGLRVFAVVRSRHVRWGGQGWSLWHGDLRYHLASQNGVGAAPKELSGVRWACPATGARLLVATADAKLRVMRFNDNTGAEASFSIEQEHDLAGLTPRPGPAPQWAKVGLV